MIPNEEPLVLMRFWAGLTAADHHRIRVAYDIDPDPGSDLDGESNSRWFAHLSGSDQTLIYRRWNDAHPTRRNR